MPRTKLSKALWLAALCVCAGPVFGDDAGQGFDETACWRSGAVAGAYRQQGWIIRDVRRIWVNPGFPDGDPALRHNAFTSLVRFQGWWYCGFRSGGDHGAASYGHVRVIRSEDGRRWEPVALFAPLLRGADLRDPKLSVAPNGTLVAASSEVYNHGPAKDTFVDQKQISRRTVAWHSTNGVDWSERRYAEKGGNTWIWSRTVWRDGIGYGVAYTGKDLLGCLYRTRDGLEWDPVKPELFPPRSALEKEHGNETGNEGALVFSPDETAFLYLRGGARSGGAHIGTARPPYTEWTWQSRIKPNIGGPEMIRLSDGRYLIAGREGWGVPHAKNNTVLWEVDPRKPSFTKIVTLPSGGDTSYPGLVEHAGELWMTYYSSHEDPNPEQRNLWNQRSCIYLARMTIGKKQAP